MAVRCLLPCMLSSSGSWRGTEPLQGCLCQLRWQADLCVAGIHNAHSQLPSQLLPGATSAQQQPHPGPPALLPWRQVQASHAQHSAPLRGGGSVGQGGWGEVGQLWALHSHSQPPSSHWHPLCPQVEGHPGQQAHSCAAAAAASSCSCIQQLGVGLGGGRGRGQGGQLGGPQVAAHVWAGHQHLCSIAAQHHALLLLCIPLCWRAPPTASAASASAALPSSQVGQRSSGLAHVHSLFTVAQLQPAPPGLQGCAHVPIHCHIKGHQHVAGLQGRAHWRGSVQQGQGGWGWGQRQPLCWGPRQGGSKGQGLCCLPLPHLPNDRGQQLQHVGAGHCVTEGSAKKVGAREHQGGRCCCCAVPLLLLACCAGQQAERGWQGSLQRGLRVKVKVHRAQHWLQAAAAAAGGGGRCWPASHWHIPQAQLHVSAAGEGHTGRHQAYAVAVHIQPSSHAGLCGGVHAAISAHPEGVGAGGSPPGAAPAAAGGGGGRCCPHATPSPTPSPSAHLCYSSSCSLKGPKVIASWVVGWQQQHLGRCAPPPAVRVGAQVLWAHASAAVIPPQGEAHVQPCHWVQPRHWVAHRGVGAQQGCCSSWGGRCAQGAGQGALWHAQQGGEARAREGDVSVASVLAARGGDGVQAAGWRVAWGLLCV